MVTAMRMMMMMMMMMMKTMMVIAVLWACARLPLCSRGVSVTWTQGKRGSGVLFSVLPVDTVGDGQWNKLHSGTMEPIRACGSIPNLSKQSHDQEKKCLIEWYRQRFARQASRTISDPVICHAMLNYALLFYTTLYYTILYYTILYYAMLCYALLCYLTL